MHKPPFTYADLDEIVYLFQGGGALGAFQVGVFQALEEFGYVPDWIVGISIGSLNASIIAGNPPGKRAEMLYKFWDSISHQIEPLWDYSDTTDNKLFTLYNQYSALYALLFGQTGFFKPARVNPWFIDKADPTHLSFYDTSPLRNTLLEVIDFEYLNKAYTRLTVGAVNIVSGKLKFFDNKKQALSVEHIMASCALPPGFPAVEIEGNFYWDGGLYSNTPLISIINDLPHKNRLCFLVDLFDSTGVIPTTLERVLERSKDITYAGVMDTILGYYDLQLQLQKHIHNCISNLPDHLKKDPNIVELAKYGDSHNVHIAKIIYRANVHECHSKDYEFSNFSVKRHIMDGFLHTKNMLSNPDWWNDPQDHLGTLVHTMKDLNIIVGDPGEQQQGE